MPYKTKYWFIDRTRLLLFTIIPALLPLGAMAFYRWLPWWVVAFFCFTKGMVAWTLLEYALHRWVLQRRALDGHDVLHDSHHFRERQFWAVLLAVTLATFLFMPQTFASARVYFLGMSMGNAATLSMVGVFPALLPHSLHQRVGRQRQRHAASGGRLSFGICTTAWDRVFGTCLQSRPDNAHNGQKARSPNHTW